MNILQLVFSSAWGGLEILVGVFATKFKQQGHNVLGVFAPNIRMEEVFRKNNINFSIVKPVFKYLDLFTAWKIKSILKENKIDIIHVYQSGDLSTAVLLKKILNTGKIVFTQQMDSRYDKFDFFHKWIYRNLDMVVCATNNMKKNHLEHTPILPHKISVIYNGTDLSRFRTNINFDKHAFLNEKLIPTNSLIIGTIGRLDRFKNQALLINIAPDLIKKHKEKIHFIFVGDETDSPSGKNYKNELISKIKDKDLDEYFSIFEFSKEVEKYFTILDIFVLTTTKESFGFVLVEAMAMGKPVIASKLGGPPEIINNGDNGYLFDPDDTDELTGQLSQLIDNEELRMSMGKKSIKIVKDKFDLDKKVDEYLSIFKSII